LPSRLWLPTALSSSKDKDKHCRVIEQKTVSEDQLTMQIGKQGYPSREEANIDVKVLCDNS